MPLESRAEANASVRTHQFPSPRETVAFRPSSANPPRIERHRGSRSGVGAGRARDGIVVAHLPYMNERKPTSVETNPPSPARRPLRIVCALRSPEQHALVQEAYRFAHPVALRLVHVVRETSGEVDELDQALVRARNWLLVTDAKVRPFGLAPAHCDVRFGESVEETLEAAAKDHAADLVIVGGTTRDPEEPWSSTLPERLTRRGPCNVLVVRPHATGHQPRGIVDPPRDQREGLDNYEPMIETPYEPSDDRVRRAELPGTFGRPV